MTIVTRFPPSPGSSFHIGSARTALFNWLYAKHTGGRFLLRIEDTDKEKSNEIHVDSIIDGLKWLELDYEGEAVYQSDNINRHVEIANRLVNEGKAYYCYCTQEDLEQMKEEQINKGLPVRYDGKWRDKTQQDAPSYVKPTIRLKTPHQGETVVNDLIQGEIKVMNEQLDDMVLLRSDGTPTYMLSVIVDDHDMKVNTIIRTSEHLTNTFRQIMVLNALNWEIPTYAHIPLIHSNDGEKLSKYNGITSIQDFKELGYLPEAIKSYLLTLGWSNKNDEILEIDQAVKLFDLKDMVKSPAQFNIAKLSFINGHYIRKCDNQRLLSLIIPIIHNSIGIFPEEKEKILLDAMDMLKQRAKNLIELAQSAEFIIEERPILIPNQAMTMINEKENQEILKKVIRILEILPEYNHDTIKSAVISMTVGADLKLEQVAPLIRATISGNEVSPPIFHIMEIMGKEETILRIKDQIC